MEMDDSDDEHTEPMEVVEEILGMMETRKTLIYCLHTLLDQFELHLDAITKKYKSMCITLLLATFAAVGFLFSSELSELKINKLIVSSMICLFGMICTFSLWYLDIQVFHKFWGAFFVEEVRMEKAFRFLIDIGDVSMSLDNIRLRIFGNGNFYISIICLLIVTGGVSLSFLADSYIIKLLVFIITGAFSFLIIKLMIRSCNKLQKALESLLGNKYKTRKNNKQIPASAKPEI